MTVINRPQVRHQHMDLIRRLIQGVMRGARVPWTVHVSSPAALCLRLSLQGCQEICCHLPPPSSGCCAGAGGLRGATPCSRPEGAAVRKYPSTKVRSSGCALLEQL